MSGVQAIVADHWDCDFNWRSRRFTDLPGVNRAVVDVGGVTTRAEFLGISTGGSPGWPFLSSF
jgi:hypothetical protein